MAEEHLEAAASGQAEGWFEQRKDPGFRKRQDASLFQTITLVMLPFIWAGFVYSLVTGNEILPVSRTIANLLSKFFYVDVRVKMAAMLLAMIPPMVIYVIFQKRVIEGMTMSSVKG